jgi:hypothetical protein
MTVYGMIYRAEEGQRPRWAWLLWEQIALVFTLSLGAYLRLLDASLIAKPGFDKAAHFALCGTLSFLLLTWIASPKPHLVLSGLLAVAGLEELAQLFCQARSFDPLDLLATAAGVLIFGRLASRLSGSLARFDRVCPRGDHNPAYPKASFCFGRLLSAGSKQFHTFAERTT